MTDRHAHRQTHTQTDKPSDEGEKHNTFFQRYKNTVSVSFFPNNIKMENL